MSDTQHDWLSKIGEQLIKYMIEKSSAFHDGKRPGLKYSPPEGILPRSCGAFRAWAVFAKYKNIACAADGYRLRSYPKSGVGLWVLSGPESASFVFPLDDSRSHHSLRLRCTDNGTIINVTGVAGPWDNFLPYIASELERSLESLREAIIKYDSEERAASRRARDNEIQLAIKACEVIK